MHYNEFFNFNLCVPIVLIEGMHLTELVLTLQKEKIIVIHKIEDSSHPVFIDALKTLKMQQAPFKIKAVLLAIHHTKVYNA